MKRYAFLLGIFLFGSLAHAQETQKSDEINTVFGKGGDVKVGWVISGQSGYTQFDKQDVWLGGITAGMVINHNFTIGLSGSGWGHHDGLYFPDVTDTAGAYLEGGYGGLLLEYTLFPESVVHVTFPVLIGGGGASYAVDSDYYDWEDDEWDTECQSLDHDAYFVIEPGVRAEVNLLKFMRLDAGVGYHYVAGLDMINTSGNMMNNFTVNVGLKFGKF
jgi:hypothetical protein